MQMEDSTVANAINWFEIPAVDFERAVSFYSAIMGAPVIKGEFQGVPHGFFPAPEGAATGAIVGGTVVAGGEPRAGAGGVVIYLNAGAQIEAIAARVEAAGGKLVTPPTHIAPQGQIALFIDSEGNRVGLHQPPM
jgi:predicted enzyme related to lactoylglutathione lyase